MQLLCLPSLMTRMIARAKVSLRSLRLFRWPRPRHLTRSRQQLLPRAAPLVIPPTGRRVLPQARTEGHQPMLSAEGAWRGLVLHTTSQSRLTPSP